jgi:hypothetical protein
VFLVSSKKIAIVALPEAFGSAFQDSNSFEAVPSAMRGSEPPGTLSPELAEPAVKVRQVIEPGAETDLDHGLVCFNEKATGLAHPELREVINEGLPDSLPEKPAESLGGHTGHIRHLRL